MLSFNILIPVTEPFFKFDVSIALPAILGFVIAPLLILPVVTFKSFILTVSTAPFYKLIVSTHPFYN